MDKDPDLHHLVGGAGKDVVNDMMDGKPVSPDLRTLYDSVLDKYLAEMVAKHGMVNGRAIRQVCARFVALCRAMGLLTEASVAIDGSKFKAVNNRSLSATVPDLIE
jgi:hypothetical protein